MARAADRFRPAGLASLLLHGGALLALLAGLPPTAPPPVPQVIELAFLPAMEEAAEQAPEAEPVADQAAPLEPAPEPPTEAVQDAARDAPAEPIVEESSAPVTQEIAVPPRAEPPQPAPAPVEAAALPPRPAPQPRPVRPRAMPRATATAPSPAPAAPAAATNAPSAPPAPPRAVPQSYIAALFAALDRRKEYPESARWRRAEGTAILRVALHRDGSVQAWRIERGSGHEDLDQAIGTMVRRASPLPAPPAELPGDPVEFSIPVRFSLR